MSMLLAKLDWNTLQVEVMTTGFLCLRNVKNHQRTLQRPSYPPTLHAYKSTRVRTREIRIDPMSPTVFEKKKNMVATTRSPYI
jgi:hypothetical protein